MVAVGGPPASGSARPTPPSAPQQVREAQRTCRGARQPPLRSRHVARDAMLIALSGAWCFVKKKNLMLILLKNRNSITYALTIFSANWHG